MQIKITRPFQSKILGQCEVDSIVSCDNALGKAIILSNLGEEVEVATTKDIPIHKVTRKRKRITRRQVETAAIEIETA